MVYFQWHMNRKSDDLSNTDSGHKQWVGMLIFKKFFSRVKNLNSRELDRVSMGITALWYGFQEKNTLRIAWSWLVRTGVEMSSNIFVPSGHSDGESWSRVPGQMCGPRELVKRATRSDMDGHLLSLGLRHSACLIPEFWVHILTASAVLHLRSRLCTYKKLPDVRRRICHGYIKQSAGWAFLK